MNKPADATVLNARKICSFKYRVFAASLTPRGIHGTMISSITTYRSQVIWIPGNVPVRYCAAMSDADQQNAVKRIIPIPSNVRGVSSANR